MCLSGGTWDSEKQQAEASPVIGANAAFNNRTKEETGNAYVLKMWIFPQNSPHSVALVILY